MSCSLFHPFIKKFTFSFLFLIVLVCADHLQAQLNGTYTIGPAAGDYATFTEAMADLNAQGVSGPVTFEAEDGVYNEQFEIGQVSGTSAENTVTIRSASGDSSTVTVYYEATGTEDNYVAKINATAFLTLEHLTLWSGGASYSRVLHLDGPISEFTMQHCAVIGVPDMSGDSRSLMYAFNAQMDAVIIQMNRFEDGAYGMDFDLDTDGTNLVIRDNYFLNNFGAVSLDGQQGAVIMNNWVENAYRRGFELNNCDGEMFISGNHIDVEETYGINMSSCYGGSPPLSEPGLIANNFITVQGTGTCNGIRLYNCTYQNVFFNSISARSTDATYTAALYLNGGSNVTVQNNNLACENDGYGLYVNTSATIVESDYNNIYSPGNNLAYWEENVPDIDSLRVISGMDAHSLSVYPHYQSATDLHTTAPWLDGKGTTVADISDDIDGEPRTDPDIGADEFTPAAGTETPLSGTYTIGLNPYQTFQDAVDDLILRGVSGPVILEAVNGTYNEQLELLAVPGVSEANTVTFRSQGGDAGYVTLYHGAESSDDNYVFRLKGAGFIRLEHMTMQASSSPSATYGRVLQLKGGVHDVVVSDCQLIGSPVLNSGADALSVVYASQSNGPNRRFEGNTFHDGSYGIHMSGFHFNTPSEGPSISDNTFMDQYRAIYLLDQVSPVLSGNTIRASRGGGVHLERCDRELTVIGNDIEAVSGYALTLHGCDGGLPPLERPGLTANNFIRVGGESTAEGIRLYSSTYQNIYYNSVNVSSTHASTGRTFTVNSGNDISVLNNIFNNSGGGYATYTYAPAANTTSDYNDYYTSGSVLAYLNGDQVSLSDFQNESGQESNSISADPGFLSDTDLHATAAGPDSAATPLEEVTTDIDGDLRDATFPDMGADEYGSTAAGTLFSEIPAGIDGAAWGSTAWGDYNKDGELDLLVTGSTAGTPMVSLYENDQGAFYTVEHAMEALASGCASWVDFSGDNYLDILISGVDGEGEPQTKLYRNNQSGGFTAIDAGIIGVSNSSVDWGDYDNDGDPDLLITGNESGLLGNITRIYRNEGNSVFSEINAGLPGVPNGVAHWADFNSDGNLDVFLFGEGSFLIYQNQGDDIFYNLNIGFPGMAFPAAACADYDNDGDPDIVVSGSEGGNVYVTKLYRNDGNNNFSERELAGLPGMASGDLKWGDYDNDGYPDLFMIGATDSTIEAFLYRNNQNNTFSRVDMSFTGAMDGSVSWGDYNNDEKLDLVYSGRDPDLVSISKVYVNNTETGNNAPSIPDGITQSVSSDFAVLEWNPSTDNETPQDGLTYNIRMGTASGATDVATPMSTDGYLFLPGDGNRGSKTRIYAENLTPNTTYYWSVQAVDKGFRTSAFSTERSFQTEPAAEGLFIEHGADFTGITGGDLLWAKFFVTNHEQIMQSGWMGNITGEQTTIFDKVDGFYQVYDAGLQDLDQSAIDVGDFDNDGDLDIIHIGKQFGGTPFTILYETESDWPNSLGAHFTPVATQLPDVYDGDVAFGDYDNDGDLDILITGKTSTDSIISAVYFKARPDVMGREYDRASIQLPGVFNSAVAWIDYDVDGDHDILLSGEGDDGEPFTALYTNDDGAFAQAADAFMNLKNGSVAWADYNNDGYPDILICGEDADEVPRTLIYTNSNGQFSESGISLIGIHSGNASFVDYDADGDYDIAMSGIDAAGDHVTRFYNGGADGTFGINNQTGIIDAGGGAIAWGNADADEKIDVALTGFDGNDRVMKIYHNNMVNENTHPQPPSGQTATVISDDEILFTWQPGSDNETPQAGLTYNLRIGTEAGGNDIMAVSTDNIRRCASRHGNVGHNLSWRIKGLDQNDQYYWSVQTVDNGFLASEFIGGIIYMSSVFTAEPAFDGGLPLTDGTLHWVDFNTDRRLDIFMTGRTRDDVWIRKIMRNNGDGSFEEIPYTGQMLIPGPQGGDVDFGDLEGDGDIDFVITGRIEGDRQTRVYRNEGGFEFIHQTNLGGLALSSVKLGDMDNNGMLDILLAGEGSDQDWEIDERFYYYKNHGDLVFTREFNKDGFSKSSIDIGDYDGDSDNDILLMGYYYDHGSERRTRILSQFRTLGKFQNIHAGFPGMSLGQCNWIDIDNDADLDVFFSGRVFDGSTGTFFAKNISESFPVEPRLSPSYRNSVADFGDYDNDGDMDMLICGMTSEDEAEYCLWQNDDGEFKRTGFALNGVFGGAAAFGDYDDDGDLDIVVSGYHRDAQENRYPFCYLYKNNTGTPNDRPSVPSNLLSQVGTESVELSWSPSEDDNNPAHTLTYNLKVGTYPGRDDIMPSNAHPDGTQLIAKSGNVRHATRWILIGLKPGTYYWTVQAVDHSFQASAFAATDSFTIRELSFYPEITNVMDVPHDQGGHVQIHWLATQWDTHPDTIKHYSIWRALPEDQQSDDVLTGDHKTLPMNIDFSDNTQSTGALYWEWLADQPARQLAHYAYTAETLYDSTSRTDGHHHFMVVAHHANSIWTYPSNMVTGYSIDNLSPEPPQNVTGRQDGARVVLSWAENTESDLRQYLIYRSESPGLDPARDSLYAVVNDTLFIDSNPVSGVENYYIVCAQDIHDNISEPGDEISILVTGITMNGGEVPEKFFLYQNYPNPFNPYSTITFDLPEHGDVTLQIYNLLGENVATLVDRSLAAGKYKFRWEPQGLSSGVYVYVIQANNFRSKRKMVLVK